MILKSEKWYNIERMDFEYERIATDLENKIVEILNIGKCSEIFSIRKYFYFFDANTDESKNHFDEGYTYLLFDLVKLKSRLLFEIMRGTNARITPTIIKKIEIFERKRKIINLLSEE